MLWKHNDKVSLEHSSLLERRMSTPLQGLKPVFHWDEFCARSVIFRQNCAATKLKTVRLFSRTEMSLLAQNSA